MTDINGNNTETTFTTGLTTDTVQNLTDNAHITLTDNTINLEALNVLVNGEPISLPTVLPHNLDLGEYDITGPLGLSLTGINTKTQHISADAGFTIVGSILQAPIIRCESIADYIGDGASIDLTQTSINMYVPTLDPILNFNDKPIIYTPYPNQIQANSFKRTGGTNEEYMLADGSVLKQSANSGNSNYYLFNSSTTQDTTPPIGDIAYNNAVQANATFIYISHRTRDNVDIEVFLKQLSTLTDVYIQDQETSVNYIQYNITADPIITPEAQVAIPVSLRIGGGTGLTNFPNGHNILLSFFTNGLEVDTRISTLETTTNSQSTSITNLETKTQYQSIVGLITSFTNGLRINGPVFLNGASILDVATINRPYYGLQYQHNSNAVPTVQSSSLITAFGSTALSAAPWVKTNNYTRQYGCGLWTTGGLADGAVCGYGGTVSTGAYVTMDLGSTFGLSYSLAIADSAYNVNNCQNFFGLWWLQSAIPLNQTTQLNVQRNMLCFGSSTNDPNICIYSAGASTTVKWVDLGGYFPSNIEASGALTNFFKFLLYWDGTTIYYRADNTSFPDSVVDAHKTGQFTPSPGQYPTASCTNQCVRIMGTPQSNGQGRLKVQRFGVF